MLHFGMNMPFLLMSFYGSLMILIVLLFRVLLKKRLPKFVFPIIWCVVLIRLLLPFSLSSPLTIRISDDSPLYALSEFANAFAETISVTEDTEVAYTETAIEDVMIRTMPTAFENGATENIVCVEEKSTVTDDTLSPGAVDIIQSAPEVSKDLGSTYPYTTFPHLPFTFNYTLLQVIYTIGFILTAGILLWQRYHYNRKLKKSLLVEHNETINGLLREMDMGHILVFTNDEIASPLTCGLLAPRIYLPTRMDFQNRELLRHILLHETMHIKRKDNWTKVFLLAALIINWFNPLVWIMSKYFAADLESACDEAVLRHCHDEDERKDYAFNLLAMAITGSRTTLLYSAFSKTEVEKRIQSILNYKRASALLLAIAVCFMTCSTVAFATCAQAPFSPYLTSYCASDACRWGVKIYATRDLTLGKDAQKRAEDIVLDVLSKNTDNDPVHMNEQILTALSNEFHVEKGAFRTDFSLCLDDEEQAQEYAAWELSRDENGIWHYKGEPVRIFIDEAGGCFYSHSEGTVDITVIRDRFGFISDIRVRHDGDVN
ncbi:MAG: M56 family metallopeptidase [Lachnospiraceae bacterium]|nr:M56 family metallopeptidase [Lachnospiraceae bacterium]